MAIDVLDDTKDTKDEGIRSLYWRHFDARDAQSSHERRLVHRLRYQVYCIENPFENPAQHPEGLEIDQYDDHSLHALLMHRATGHAMGTVRIVLPVAAKPEASFAIQKICAAPEIRDRARFPLETTGEISRFCIAKMYRRRIVEKPFRTPDERTDALLGKANGKFPNMTLGLIQWLVQTSRAQGLTHWAAVMEPQLLRLLARFGIHFEPIGDLVDYHGWRQPCVVELDALLARVERERADIWSIINQPALIPTYA